MAPLVAAGLTPGDIHADMLAMMPMQSASDATAGESAASLLSVKGMTQFSSKCNSPTGSTGYGAQMDHIDTNCICHCALLGVFVLEHVTSCYGHCAPPPLSRRQEEWRGEWGREGLMRASEDHGHHASSLTVSHCMSPASCKYEAV